MAQHADLSFVQRMWQEARTAWPGIDLPEDRFAARVGHAGDPAALHAADLYLACACAEGDPAALALFEQRVLSQVPAFLAHLRLSGDAVADVGQEVRARLFLGSSAGPPRIGSYDGRGPLGAWVRTMAVRMALNRSKRKDEQAAHPGEQVIEKLLGGAADPELEIIKARYRDAFRDAVRDAVAGLPEEQRGVLQLHLVAGLSTTRIGALFQVSHTTVSRWLLGARETIFGETRRLIGERLGVTSSDFESLVRLLRSQLDVSLIGVLGPGSGAAEG